VAKELPPKTEILHEIEMGEAQKDLYETVRSTMDKQVRQALAIRGQQAQIVFLDALLKLRQICCHPRLLGEDHASGGSAKFDYLVDLLETFREEGHRVLVFSQFTTMLDLIEAHLIAEEVSYLKLTGATKDRQSLVERFQGGEGLVFLISLKAGGTGLTLTGADTVIHYDPWWNPAAENQATDRAYRIGQDKPVFVHKLICRSTVEERIQLMQEKKDDIASDLLSGAATGIDLSPETMAGLLGDF
jgi:SNF2 family DNA or RNA helicase